MRIYLSGPMSGYKDSNFPEFHRIASALRERGLDVVNPAEIVVGDPPNEGDKSAWDEFYNSCMRADIKAMCDCQAIAMMTGWESSKGAHLELHIAHRVGLAVKYVSDLLA